MTTAITQKGQVTIPKELRDRFKLLPGATAEFYVNEQGELALRLAGKSKRAGRFEWARGIAGPGMTTAEIMRLTRGEDWGEE